MKDRLSRKEKDMIAKMTKEYYAAMVLQLRGLIDSVRIIGEKEGWSDGKFYNASCYLLHKSVMEHGKAGVDINGFDK